jgi:hypothetical protein
MKFLGFSQIATILMVLAAAPCISCNRPASTSTTTATKSAKPGPEESLTDIMGVFRRRMEDTPIGFVATNSSGRSAMTGTNKVSYELVRPAADGEPYKAFITVVSTSHYSVLRTVETDKEDSRDKESNGKSTSILDEPDPNAIPINSEESDATTEETPNDKKGPKRPGEEKVGRQKDQATRTYELIYENGRWDLVTKLNEQTEQAVGNAFKNALGTQI